MVEFWLIAALGFLGSFGHCVGMCGPLAIAFSLSQGSEAPKGWRQWVFHGLLNLGRILSYVAVGAMLGGVGSLVVAGGQLAGLGSSLRHGIAIFTGLLLIWLGLRQVQPNLLPPLPFLHPLTQGTWHQRFSGAMAKLSLSPQWWTPALLGLLWGLIPCGFLYTAQLKAAETGNPWMGAAMMGMFGLGTLPMMVGVGALLGHVGSDRRSQLFRMGGWITLLIGLLTLLRTDAMVDFTGHGALLLLWLALVARPLRGVWAGLLRYRRTLGVGAFLLAIAHTAHMLTHALQWNMAAIAFLIPLHRWGLLAGALSLGLMLPAALTSFDRAVRALGHRWRSLHLLTVPALLLATGHALCNGSNYLGNLQLDTSNWLRAAGLVGLVAIALLLRQPQTWTLLSLKNHYTPPNKPH